VSSADSGFTSDVARVLRGRVSHQKVWGSKNSEFCSRAKVGPLQRLIRGKLGFAVGPNELQDQARQGQSLVQGRHWPARKDNKTPFLTRQSGQTSDRSADSRPVDGRKTCPTPTPISSPTVTHGIGLAASHQTARAVVCSSRLCSFRLRLLIGQ